MIKDIISKKGNYAFLCKDKNHFKVCVRQTHDEGIVFSKSIPFGGRDLEPFVEGYDYIIENYIKHLSDSNVCALMKNTGDEIQFYSRDLNNSDGFFWNDWEVIDYTYLLRDVKLNNILND
jgi:hypothetical protein